MRYVARAAAGLLLVAAAAPTTSLAEPVHNFGTGYFMNSGPDAAASQVRKNSRQKQSSRHARSRTASARAAAAAPAFALAGFGQPHWIGVARRYKGTNPTRRRSLWCADFLNLVLEKSGMRGSGSSMARSFASYGTRLSGPKVGAIAVMARGKRGGHVGIVTEIDSNGNPVIISGNHNNTVAEATYSRGRVVAYVWPTSG